MRATRWDTIVLTRATVVAVIALAVAWLFTAASDEGALSWGARAGRVLPLTPLCAALGVWAALAHVRGRGELRALEALGQTPAGAAFPAVAGGALIALVAAGAMGAVHGIDISGFYPVATQTRAWQWHNGGFEERELGLRVGADGAPVRFAPALAAAPGRTTPSQGRLAAALATAISGLAMAGLTACAVLGPSLESRGKRQTKATERALAVDALASGVAVASTVALFQAAAANRTPALAGVVPPLALFALALQRYRALT